jgi:hypothetical protein
MEHPMRGVFALLVLMTLSATALADGMPSPSRERLAREPGERVWRTPWTLDIPADLNANRRRTELNVLVERRERDRPRPDPRVERPRFRDRF